MKYLFKLNNTSENIITSNNYHIEGNNYEVIIQQSIDGVNKNVKLIIPTNSILYITCVEG